MIKGLSSFFISMANRFLPSPFVLTLILSFLVFFISIFFTRFSVPEIAGFWEKGFWQLLKFSMQMSLILILGYVLASTPLITGLINNLVAKFKNADQAVYIISASTLIVALLNWGLGLIYGAVLARKYGEYAKTNKQKINYPLVAAAAYSGLLIWHGGFSGSAPLSVASDNLFNIPGLGKIGIENTILSVPNLVTSLLLILIIPTVLYLISKFTDKEELKKDFHEEETDDYLSENKDKKMSFSDKLDISPYISKLLAAFLFFVVLILIVESDSTFGFITLNFVNLFLLMLGLFFHKSIAHYTSSFENATRSASGIILLFPFYAGIMGVMNYAGITESLSRFISEYATEMSFPLLSFFSAGLVNLFVPSGGGQWAVQGPLLIQSSMDLNIPVNQTIMAFSYGDELTNMLQPFWALPLLGITKIKAKEILPYSMIIMLIAIPIFIFGIYLY